MGGVRWLSLDAKPDDPAATSDDSVSIDPLFTRLGLGIRF
jgi:hypothetical protein